MATFSTGYVFGFATAVCVVCSVAVAGVSMSLSDRQQLNRERDLHKNILLALGLPGEGEPEPTGEQIDRLWEERVEMRFLTPKGAPADEKLDQDGDGDLDLEDLEVAADEVDADDPKDTPELLGVYVRLDEGKVAAIAIPMQGNGLWGPISGYLAVDPGATEVTGATFFAPKETPGLGAEIMETPFEAQWVGKDIVDASKASAPVRVVKGKPSDLCPDDLEHCVEGVSGATITSRGVDEMVARSIEWYDGYLTAIRGGSK